MKPFHKLLVLHFPLTLGLYVLTIFAAMFLSFSLRGYIPGPDERTGWVKDLRYWSSALEAFVLLYLRFMVPRRPSVIGWRLS